MGRIPENELEERRVAMIDELRARTERSGIGSRVVEQRNRRGALSRVRMRTLLLPAFAIVLLVHFGSRSGAPLGVHAAFTPGTGSSFAGPRVFDSGSDGPTIGPIRLEPGDVVGATSGTGCMLSLGHGELHLEPGARAAVASLIPPRVRFLGGKARATGRLRIVTAHGILDVNDGDVQLQLDNRGLGATLVEGAATVTGPDGVHELIPAQMSLTR